jgi:ABC-type ATPase with predicted acetyltransferase domain
LQNYLVHLKSDSPKSFRCQKAANSVDLDLEKKLEHRFEIQCDIETPFNVGLIIGSSGSGKTTLAKQIFGQNVFENSLDQEKPIIDQFDEKYSVDECISMLNAIGLSQVPCWVRPVKTLSNGQKSRAEAVLEMSRDKNIVVLDEWTSVVDRNVAKVMCHSVQKYARKNNKKIILLSCHYDVSEWLLPDFVIDCNEQKYENRRSLRQIRNEKIEFNIRECSSKKWKQFSKYHYLSDNMPGGKNFTYGLFLGDKQIGFQCFSNYVLGRTDILHSNRTVIHPDYVGFGLGGKLIEETSRIMKNKGYKIMAKFSSMPVYKSLIKNKSWRFLGAMQSMKSSLCGGVLKKEPKAGFRTKVTTFGFEFIG